MVADPLFVLPIILTILFLIIMLANALFLVRQQTNVIIERFGKFNSIRKPGLNIIIPFIDKKVDTISLKICQLDVRVETKTKDDVFVKLNISVQFKIDEQDVKTAFYTLDSPEEQIKSYVFDVVRASIPNMLLNDVFSKKDEIAMDIKKELVDSMKEYGYTIVKALVTDIDPDENVKTAMNRINAAERLKIAAEHEGEAAKILTIKKAEGESESKRLQGKGVASQRQEIAEGLKKSVEILQGVGIDPSEASVLIVVTQHYDTLQTIGANTNSSLLLLPSSPGSVNDITTQLIAAMKSAKNFS